MKDFYKHSLLLPGEYSELETNLFLKANGQKIEEKYKNCNFEVEIHLEEMINELHSFVFSGPSISFELKIAQLNQLQKHKKEKKNLIPLLLSLKERKADIYIDIISTYLQIINLKDLTHVERFIEYFSVIISSSHEKSKLFYKKTIKEIYGKEEIERINSIFYSLKDLMDKMTVEIKNIDCKLKFYAENKEFAEIANEFIKVEKEIHAVKKDLEYLKD